MSDLTTLATIRRAINIAGQSIGPKASAQYALAKLDEALKDAMTPERLREAAPAAPQEFGVPGDPVMGQYRLGEVVEVVRMVGSGDPEEHWQAQILIEFREPVTGDDVRALYALLKARPAVAIPLTSAPEVTGIVEGFSYIGERPPLEPEGAST